MENLHVFIYSIKEQATRACNNKLLQRLNINKLNEQKKKKGNKLVENVFKKMNHEMLQLFPQTV